MGCGFEFDNTYARELEGFYVPSKATEVPHPKLLRLNRGLAEELGLDPDALSSDQGAAIFAGNALPEGSRPLALSITKVYTPPFYQGNYPSWGSTSSRFC